jgi:hypothetical protein
MTSLLFLSVTKIEYIFDGSGCTFRISFIVSSTVISSRKGEKVGRHDRANHFIRDIRVIP